MRVLLDSSTLIAAMLPDHPHHAQAHRWLAQAKAEAFDFIVSGHSIAELYAVLTRLPRKPRIGPAAALRLIQENVTSHATVATLSGDDYISLVESLSQAGISGGAVYDAVIAKAAESARVDHLITLNASHFARVWPAGADRIRSPETSSPPSSL